MLFPGAFHREIQSIGILLSLPIPKNQEIGKVAAHIFSQSDFRQMVKGGQKIVYVKKVRLKQIKCKRKCKLPPIPPQRPLCPYPYLRNKAF